LGDDLVAFDNFSVRWDKLKDIALPDNFRLKDIRRIKALTEIRLFYEEISKNLVAVDGIIFIPSIRNSLQAVKRAPIAYYDDKIYKWKPSHLLTLDFYVTDAPPKLKGLPPFDKKKVLCCGANIRIIKLFRLTDYYALNREYRMIPFQPALDNMIFGIDLDVPNGVYEFSYTQSQFKMLRAREDKTRDAERGMGFGNDFAVADKTFFSAVNPVLIEQFEGLTSEYFHKAKPEAYKELTKHNNLVKGNLLRIIPRNSFVIDLASGLGQDLIKYNKLNIKTLLCSDISLDALEELNMRRYNLQNPMRLMIRHVDLKLPHEEVVEKLNIGTTKANVVVINLAIHYLISDLDSLSNFMNIVDGILDHGGYFIFTTFDGVRVRDYIETKQSSDGKFAIKRLYAEYDNISKISVKHHFGEEYEENLLDGKWLRQEIVKRQYIFIKSLFFNDVENTLDPVDLAYSSLYVGYVFKKS
jgi:hypothetical protein